MHLPRLRTLLLGVAVAAAGGVLAARAETPATPEANRAQPQAQTRPATPPATPSAQAQPQAVPAQDNTRVAAGEGQRNSEDTLRERVNSNVIGLVSASLQGAYARVATDLMVALGEGDKLRILPIITKGSLSNIRDLLYLRGIDIGIVQSDVLTYLEEKKIYSNIKNRINYITTLYNEEFHLIAHESIESIQDLEGKVVNFADVGSGTAMTTEVVFSRLGIPVKQVNFPHQVAFEKIKSGEIAAMVWIAGKPASGIANLKAEDGYKFLSIPFGDAVSDTYLPTEFTAEDYPNLVAPGESVETLAVPAVLAAYNWPDDSERARRVAKFIDTFFSKFKELQKPAYHPKWKEVNLNARLPGWNRVPAAQRWLDQATAQAEARKPDGNDLSRNEEAMFQDFLEWRRSRNADAN